MAFLFTLLSLAALAAAYPGQLLAKRPLMARDMHPRTGCPGYLTAGEYEFPHYISYISQAQPDTAFGPQYDALFTPNDMATVFTFDIPAARADANCTLAFFFPAQEQLRTSAYTYSGGGSFFFSGYNPGSCPDTATTWNNQPTSGLFPPFPAVHMEPGNAYIIDIGPCAYSAGTCVAGMTWTNDTTFNYFQDDDTCPIGVYTMYS